MGQAAEEQLQAMQQQQLTVAEALTEQLSTEHAARTNAEEIAQASAIETVQELMQHQIDEASTLRQQLSQECTAREEAGQAAQVKADECAVMVNGMEAQLSVGKTAIEIINEQMLVEQAAREQAEEAMNEMVKTVEALEQELKEEQAAHEQVEFAHTSTQLLMEQQNTQKESLKQMLSTQQAAKEQAEEAAAAATVVLEAMEHRMNRQKASVKASNPNASRCWS